MPVRDHERVVLGHGGGGILSAELVEHLILPALGPAASTATPTDAAVLAVDMGDGNRLAFTTDSYVVQPLEFPGGTIGDLAVNGTVNDLAMVGARPVALSCALVLEEGLQVEVLRRVVTSMGAAARRAGVAVVTGDTKVVEAGRGDGLIVNTAGVGVVRGGVDVRPERARPGDVVIVSGSVARHGIAVMSVRAGIEFGTEVRSDTAPLHDLVAAVLAVDASAVHALRDPTRGGLAGSLCELAAVAGVGIVLDETSIPVDDAVRGACGFLGLDPMHVANEGLMVAIVASDSADQVVAAMTATDEGRDAAVIGRVVEDHAGIVVARTGFGTRRVVDRPLGEQLPRIC